MTTGSNRCKPDFEALPAMLGCEDSLVASLVMQKEHDYRNGIISLHAEARMFAMRFACGANAKFGPIGPVLRALMRSGTCEPSTSLRTLRGRLELAGELEKRLSLLRVQLAEPEDEPSQFIVCRVEISERHAKLFRKSTRKRGVRLVNTAFVTRDAGTCSPFI